MAELAKATGSVWWPMHCSARRNMDLHAHAAECSTRVEDLLRARAFYDHMGMALAIQGARTDMTAAHDSGINPGRVPVNFTARVRHALENNCNNDSMQRCWVRQSHGG